ncbi:MAG: hypothetical protein GY745_23695 [Actinomycetia bacterium]|nr:hypothetical protein [Actinomycetes bacterium]MCP3912248.1 hypothetical protein [Actinomycetes bacterium]MCP4088021.1 hypothetical protein [Actinomycetes bacterium]
MFDSLGLFDAAATLPDQMEAARVASASISALPDPAGIESVVCLGIGAGGLAGDIVAAVAAPQAPVPILVHRGYSLPAFVSESTLVLVLSATGGTEETIEATDGAIRAGARLVAVTGEGPLRDLARGAQAPVVDVSESIPTPRSAIGALAVPPLLVLEQLGLFRGADQYVGLAIHQLGQRRDELTAADNPAAGLARRIGRTMPLIYGGGAIGGVAARRWKTQFNENAKVAAFANQLPELAHNDVSGWGQHGDVTRQVFTLIDLRNDEEHPQLIDRFDRLDEAMGEVVGSVHRVDAAGEGRVAQLFDLIMQGDFVSLHLAAESDIDPGPTPAVGAV